MDNSDPSERTANGVVVRVYCLALLAIVVACTGLAFRYLFRSVFSPELTPPGFVDRRLVSTVDMLDTGGARVDPGMSPMDHFHGVGVVPEPNLLAGCTVSGCHTVLPHHRDKVTRSFVNLHSTFLDCSACHDASSKSGTFVWVDKPGGEVIESPAMLRLLDMLEQPADATGPIPDKQLRTLLRETLRTAGAVPQLESILIELESTQPDSPVYHHAVARLRRIAPGLARGVYGALLTPRGRIADGRYRRLCDASRVAQVLAAQPNSPQRKKLTEQLHEQIVRKPASCLLCHGQGDEGVDFSKVGYTRRRAGQLRHLLLADMINRLRRGESFHMPTLLEHPDGS